MSKRLSRWLLHGALAAALAAPGLAGADADDPSLHGRNYTSHRQPGNTALETPGAWHGNPRHGFEVGAHWDRTWPPNGHPGFAAGAGPGHARRHGFHAGALRCGNAPWPLSNLDIEVQAE